MKRKNGPLLLTRREREVLPLLALSNEEIARRLCITERTSERHVRFIFMRLRAKSRVEAVIMALRGGIVDLEEFETNEAVGEDGS